MQRTDPAQSRLPSLQAITAMAWIAVLHRGLLLASLAFGTDPNGARISAAPGLTLFWSAGLQLPFLLLLAVPFLLAALVTSRGAAAARGLAAVVFLITMAVGLVDTGLLRYLGVRLTASQVTTYGGASLNSWELLASLRPDLVFWVLIVGATVVGAGLIAWTARRPGVLRPHPATLLIAAPLLVPGIALDPVQIPMYAPAEVVLARGLASRGIIAPEDRDAAVAALREGVEAGGPVRWASSSGLQRIPPRAALPPLPGDSLPDILIWAVESLRGAEVGFAGSGDDPSATPVLDSLAAAGIAIPRFLSNGFPSSQGVFSTLTGLWPLQDRVILSAYPELSVDAIPARLGGMGYRRAGFWGSNPDFDNQLAWGRRWFDDLSYESPQSRFLYTRRVGDAELARRLMAYVEEWDRKGENRPLLLFALTAGTHYPFTFEDSYYAPLTALGDQSRVAPGPEADVRTRYRATLAHMDRQLGRILDALRGRRTGRGLVVVVLGDHAYPAGDAVAGDLRAQPVDDFVWTSAVVAGPEPLVGPPRRLETPASQVDILPTLLDLVRDPHPYVAMGHSLLPEPDPGRSVLSVREGGLRVDRGPWSLYLPATGAPWADRAGDRRLDRLSPSEAGFTDSDVTAWRERMATWAWMVDRSLVKPQR